MRTSIRTAAVMALALGLLTTACTEAASRTPTAGTVDLSGARLVAYDGCDEMLAALRDHAAKNVGPWGLDQPSPVMLSRMIPNDLAKSADTPSHSTTNVHEAGVDEPDLVKTDGRRIITVSGGVLRVVDAASKKITGTLRLVREEYGWAQADLLISGDRALVLFKEGGILPYGAMAKIRPGPGTKYILVDLSGDPKVIGSLSPHGQHVDARQVGSTVRIVVRSAPEIAFPGEKPGETESQRITRNREAVRSAPIDAWLPRYDVAGADGKSSAESVACGQISHPADYTATSLLTVHTIDLTGDLSADAPISVAGDGDTVYGTPDSLYVTSNPRWWISPAILEDAASTEAPVKERTEVHRFDITGTGAPRYVASGEVPGRLLNQYSLSDYQGNLRVATTSAEGRTSSSGVYALKADTLAEVGRVTGLGKGERIYSVRFIGPVGYVVTFKQVDPLYTLDLRDPAAPKVTGELKISGYSAYLHPAGDGRLLGLGQEASEKGQTLGTQISLFDVRDPANPRRLAQFHWKDSGSEAEWDPHAFLYQPADGLAVLPLTNYSENGGGALVLRITPDGITEVGTIRHPKPASPSPLPVDIRRGLVIGDTLWTVSDLGLKASSAADLADRAWIPYT